MAFHVAHGGEAAPMQLVDPDYRLAFLESLMRNQHLLTPADTAPRLDLDLAVLLAPQIDATLAARRVEVVVDTSAIAIQVDRVLASSAAVLDGQARVLHSVGEIGQLNEDALSIQWICTRIHEDPNLKAAGLSATCHQHGMSSSVATISLSAAYDDREWKIHGDKADLRKGKRAKLREGVEWLGELLADAPGELRYVMVVEGLASSKPYACTKAVQDFETSCTDDAPCRVEGGVISVTPEGSSEPTTCEGKVSANPILGYMRGWSFAKALRAELCPKEGHAGSTCSWTIEVPRKLSAEGTGGKGNQRVRLSIRPDHE